MEQHYDENIKSAGVDFDSTAGQLGITSMDIDGIPPIPPDTALPLGLVDIFYFHTDYLGTPMVMTNDQANVAWTARYYPFGEVYYEWATAGCPTACCGISACFGKIVSTKAIISLNIVVPSIYYLRHSNREVEIILMPRLRHYDNLGTVRFVTFSSYRRINCLLAPGTPGLFIRHLKQAREKYSIKFFGYVIMPEHVHLVMLPPEALKLGLVIREIKSRMAREYFATVASAMVGRRIFWQKRCYDHNCRTVATVREKIVYCHNNPVKRGLVENASEYTWSSYNWYQGERNVPFDMDEYEI